MPRRAPRPTPAAASPAPSRRAGDRSLDAVLVAAAHGDAEAFAQVYEAVAPCTYGLALQVLGDPQQAEDATHEVLLQVWRSCVGFEPSGGSARAWVAGLAHRRLVERVRSGGPRTPAPPAPSGASRVGPVLAGLSPAQRRAVELTYFGGYTCHEVSAEMQVPVGTVRARVRDGLDRLQALAPGTAEPA